MSIVTPSQAYWQGAPPEYELYDAQMNIACRVEMVATPLQARILLEDHGEPAFVEEE